MNSKQVIVIRKDLNMRKGKMCAQAAHASMKVLLDMMQGKTGGIQYIMSNGKKGHADWHLHIEADTPLNNWLTGIFTKICVSVNSEQELLDIYEQSKNAGLYCSLIQDAGLTEFKGIPTYTCCAIGPNWSEDIDLITKHLPLL